MVGEYCPLSSKRRNVMKNNLKQNVPSELYDSIPCTMVANICSLIGAVPAKNDFDACFLKCRGIAETLGYHSDGYLSLKEENRFIRSIQKVAKYTYYKRSERFPLSALPERHATRKKPLRAVVMVLGHCIYVHDGMYDSFFDNCEDDVVAVWELE
jgi:hypothetical protein